MAFEEELIQYIVAASRRPFARVLAEGREAPARADMRAVPGA